MEQAVFFFMAGCACVFSVLAVTQRDIFHCALWLSMTLLSVSGIYFLLSAPFLAVIQILVYVGGIITLFVFAIKLTAHIGDKGIRQTSKGWLPSLLATGFLLYVLVRVFAQNPWLKAAPNHEPLSLEQIGHSLMANYALPFEFMSILLLAALVGAIVIGKVKK